MMSKKANSQPLSRRLRPRRFGDLIGQDLTVRLLQRAFESDRLGNALLFSGMRGVGKTTLARLVAMRLNCMTPKKSAHSQLENLSESCGVCAACKASEEERHTDVIEMDAASHTSVEDVRKILEACRYRPLIGCFKVFIIDEVHMLSKSAFNAFLKTLEAPPPHVVFIFATTEPKKIPLTVLSRCLRFDLQRLSQKVLATYLMHVCQQEGVYAEQEAVNLLAEMAEGSVRDALSLLDQVILMSISDKKISSSLVRSVLGLQSSSHVKNLLVLCALRKEKEVLELFRQLYQEGGDPVMIADQMARCVHIWSTTQQEVPEHIEQELLGRFWQMLLKGIKELKEAPWPEKAFEMLLLRMIYAVQLPALEHVLDSWRQHTSFHGQTADEKNLVDGKTKDDVPFGEKKGALKDQLQPKQALSTSSLEHPMLRAVKKHFPDVNFSVIDKEDIHKKETKEI